MVFKKLKWIINRHAEIEKDYSEILRESGLLRKIERKRLEIRESEDHSNYQLYPCNKEYSPETGSNVYDYNRFAEDDYKYTVTLGDRYFRIRAKTDGIYLTFRHVQKIKSIKRKKINPLKVSEKEISKWFSFLTKH